MLSPKLLITIIMLSTPVSICGFYFPKLAFSKSGIFIVKKSRNFVYNLTSIRRLVSGSNSRATRKIASYPSRGCSAVGANNYEGASHATKHDAYERASETGVNMPCIILVNPFSAQNVGSVARCMLNFGLTELRVVDPVCDIHTDECKALSAGAYEIVQNAKVFSSLNESIADLTRVMASSNRPRHLTQMVVTPNKAAEDAMSYHDSQTDKVGIMFGRERHGLYNDELALADVMITIPTFHHFSSLNLAQAVNIVAYELWNAKDAIVTPQSAMKRERLQPKDSDRLVRRDELEQFFKRLETQLNKRLYQKDPNRCKICFRQIRGIFQRVLLTKTEVDILQGMLTSLIRPEASPEEIEAALAQFSSSIQVANNDNEQ